MRIGIVICSRINSVRIPNKPLYRLNGIPLIQHLISRLNSIRMPVILAVPKEQMRHYIFLKDFCNVAIVGGSESDPMERMCSAAQVYGLDAIVRITHDKLFIDEKQLISAISIFQQKKDLDYLYSSQFTDGSAFEIISTSILREACRRFKNVEHVSYAIKCITDKQYHFETDTFYQNDCRFLIDFPEDIRLIETVLSTLGNSCSLEDAIKFVQSKNWIKKINLLPEITVYTCCHNTQKYVRKCMGSVAAQENFKKIEYIIVDDFSRDKSVYYISKFATIFPNVKWYKNDSNIGLASSSNRALKKARGKYIIRLDADDYFASNDALNKLVAQIEKTGKDIIYPDYYFGDLSKVEKGNLNHHPAGALFRTKALNYIKFTDGLRHYDGYDLYLRANEQLKIGYLDEPIFMYRQHDKSLSHNNHAERRLARRSIEVTYVKKI